MLKVIFSLFRVSKADWAQRLCWVHSDFLISVLCCCFLPGICSNLIMFDSFSVINARTPSAVSPVNQWWESTSRNCNYVQLAHLPVKVSGPPWSFSLRAVPLFCPLPLLQNPLVFCGFVDVLLPQGLGHVLPQAPVWQKIQAWIRHRSLQLLHFLFCVFLTCMKNWEWNMWLSCRDCHWSCSPHFQHVKTLKEALLRKTPSKRLRLKKIHCSDLDSVGPCFSTGRTCFLVTGSLVTSTTLVSPQV